MFRNIFAAVVLSLCLGLAVAPSAALADDEEDYTSMCPDGSPFPHDLGPAGCPGITPDPLVDLLSGGAPEGALTPRGPHDPR